MRRAPRGALHLVVSRAAVGWRRTWASADGACSVGEIALTVHLEDVDVMGEAVEERTGQALGPSAAFRARRAPASGTSSASNAARRVGDAARLGRAAGAAGAGSRHPGGGARDAGHGLWASQSQMGFVGLRLAVRL